MCSKTSPLADTVEHVVNVNRSTRTNAYLSIVVGTIDMIHLMGFVIETRPTATASHHVPVRGVSVGKLHHVVDHHMTLTDANWKVKMFRTSEIYIKKSLWPRTSVSYPYPGMCSIDAQLIML